MQESTHSKVPKSASHMRFLAEYSSSLMRLAPRTPRGALRSKHANCLAWMVGENPTCSVRHCTIGMRRSMVLRLRPAIHEIEYTLPSAPSRFCSSSPALPHFLLVLPLPVRLLLPFPLPVRLLLPFPSLSTASWRTELISPIDHQSTYRIMAHRGPAPASRPEPINQLTNHLTHQSINQSINQDQSIDQQSIKINKKKINQNQPFPTTLRAFYEKQSRNYGV